MAKPIISFIILLLSIGFAFFYVKPAYNVNIARRGDILSLDKILSTSNEIQTLIEKTKENLKSIDPAVLNRFEVFLPQSVDSIRFANNLQSLGIRNRIILSNITVEGASVSNQTNRVLDLVGGSAQGLANTPSSGAEITQAGGVATPAVSAASTGKKYVSTSASFSFSTSYQTFQLFLNDLEKSLGLINVTSLSFSSAAESADSAKASSVPIYQYTMTIETYSLQ